jgi:carboxypeptidase C (cathepsin A)
MKFANSMPNGCQDQISYCKQTNRTSLSDLVICTEAANMCRDNVGMYTLTLHRNGYILTPFAESPYYVFSGRGTYDIRHPSQDPTPPSYYLNYLARDDVMNALGVDLNYTQSNAEVYYAFQQTGDFVWPNFIEDLEDILTRPVRVALIYGDADYICNWFGGQAISLATNFPHSKEFRAAGYAPFLVDGVEYGETREYGNFSFTRVYEAGHEVPYYQPVASLQLFNRTLNGWELPTGEKKLSADCGTDGSATATHTESSVALPTSTPAKRFSVGREGW